MADENDFVTRGIQFPCNLISPGEIARVVRVRHIWSLYFIVAAKLFLEVCYQLVTAFRMPLIASPVNEEDLFCHRFFSFVT